MKFGCVSCFDRDAKSAWRASTAFTQVAEVVSEEHFSLTLLACPDCGQHFLKVFTELIDWQGGDDSQCWSFIPLMPDECERIVANGEDVDKPRIEEYGRECRHLMYAHPRGKSNATYWADGGFTILPHD